MRALLGRAAEGSIVNEIRRFELLGWALGDFRAEAAGPDHRAPFADSRPRGRSARAGAGLELGCQFHSLHSNGRGLVFEVERCNDGSREEVHADTIIGEAARGIGAADVAAGTAWCSIKGRHRSAPIPRWCSVPQDTPYFYWLIPESATRGALGLIGEMGRRRASIWKTLKSVGSSRLNFRVPHSGVHRLGAGATPRGARLGVLGRRRRCAGESDDGRR